MRRYSSQSNQHNGVTLLDQEAHTNYTILCSHFGAIQIYQTSGDGNPQYDPGS